MTTHATATDTQHVEQIDPRDLLVDANVRRDNRLDPSSSPASATWES